MPNENNRTIGISLSVEQADELRGKFAAERDRADRAEIEANIMLEMAVRIRELAVSFGCQVLPQSKPYAEEIQQMLENPIVLSMEVGRRFVDKRNRERKQRDVAEKTTIDHTSSTEAKDMPEVQKETVKDDSSVVSGVPRKEHEEGSGNGEGENSDSRP